MKSVLLSTQPKWCELICNLKKLIEVRKSRPKLQTPFKVYIYCSYGQLLYADYPNGRESKVVKLGGYKVSGMNHIGNMLNGKVIGEFVCDRIDEYLCEEYEWGDGDVSLEYRIRSVEGRKTCLEYDEMREYGKEKPLYFWHITDLKIYDKPKELSEFRMFTNCGSVIAKDMLCNTCCICSEFCVKKPKRITRPPQSWCYVEELRV